jgi:hypothetical protein
MWVWETVGKPRRAKHMDLPAMNIFGSLVHAACGGVKRGRCCEILICHGAALMRDDGNRGKEGENRQANPLAMCVHCTELNVQLGAGTVEGPNGEAKPLRHFAEDRTPRRCMKRTMTVRDATWKFWNWSACLGCGLSLPAGPQPGPISRPPDPRWPVQPLRPPVQGP